MKYIQHLAGCMDDVMCIRTKKDLRRINKIIKEYNNSPLGIIYVEPGVLVKGKNILKLLREILGNHLASNRIGKSSNVVVSTHPVATSSSTHRLVSNQKKGKKKSTQNSCLNHKHQ